jgi:hypothetical protein
VSQLEHGERRPVGASATLPCSLPTGAGDNKPEQNLYQRQIQATDRQIDALVYELYGLTEEEIAVVEGAVNG